MDDLFEAKEANVALCSTFPLVTDLRVSWDCFEVAPRAEKETAQEYWANIDSKSDTEVGPPTSRYEEVKVIRYYEFLVNYFKYLLARNFLCTGGTSANAAK